MSKEVYAVAHSHWDHEWYFTHEDADITLVENLDYLIATLEQHNDFACYTFDGQSSVIDRYLEIRPENRARVAKLVAGKRLFIGPWYTQADALLGKTESLIRNLNYGIRSAKALGHVMDIGYAPDIFGQHAYLPSIYRRFGLNFSVFQRGVYNEQVADNLNFMWEAPNGEAIPTNNLFFGYGPGKFLSSQPDYLEQRLQPILEVLSRRNQGTNNLLLPAGGDQVLINTDFPKVVTELNQTVPGYHFQLSDYETFMHAAWKDAANFPTYQGELIASQKSRIHNSCRSERYDIKQLNYQVEDQVLHVLEPMIAIGRRFGIEVPMPWLDEIWKKIFKSQAHNGIGASNSDAVNHDIMMRLTSASRQTLDLINIIERKLGSGLTDKQPLLVFNTSLHERRTTVSAVIFTKTAKFSLYDDNQNLVAYSITQQEVISGGRKVIVTATGEKEVDVPDYYRTELLISSITLPAFGYCTLHVIEGQPQHVDQLVVCNKTMIANSMYQIKYQDGQITIIDAAGRVIPNAFTFEDTADAGDSFDYSPLAGDQPIELKNARLVQVQMSKQEQMMELEHSVLLPDALDGDHCARQVSRFTILTTLSLRPDENFIRVHHQIANQIKDHRLTVNWQTGVTDCSHNFADQGYSLLKRDSRNSHEDNWREEGFVEKPVAIYPFESLAGVSDGQRTFSVHTGMLKEYQVHQDHHQFALTLFRSNGLLGRDDLAWRPGRASGINNKIVLTPDGQMQQTMTFDYFVAYAQGPMDEQSLFDRSEEFDTHVITYQVQTLNSFEHRVDRFQIPVLENKVPARSSGITVKNPAIFVAAVKPMADGASVLRLFNPTTETQELKISPKVCAKVVDLNDQVIDCEVPKQLASKDYVSLLIDDKSEE